VTLKRNSVRSKHIARNAVTSPKVKDQSLFARDFAPGQLPQGERGPQGAQALPGERGLPGEQGPPGPAGATNVVSRESAEASVIADDDTSATASCNPGERAVGGGFHPELVSARDWTVLRSQPTGSPPNAWIVEVANRDDNNDNTGVTLGFRAVVVCASP
jgi:hypothetical protein